MSVKFVDLPSVKYLPRTTDKTIRILVEVGDAEDQSSVYAIFLGQTLKGLNQEAQIGTKNQIEDQSTTVTATIIDQLEETNWTSVTVIMNEGNLPAVEFGPYSEEVAAHLDTIVYTLKIEYQ